MYQEYKVLKKNSYLVEKCLFVDNFEIKKKKENQHI